jgi:AcrR family transcriptional regulator
VALERLSSAERKRQIAEAALHILAAQGAHRLTAREISRMLVITDAAVFRHFRDKDEIVAAAIGRFEEVLAGDVPAGDVVALGGDALVRLGGFFVRRVHKARAHPEILGLAFNDRLAEIAGPDGAARVHRMVGRSVAFVRSCLDEAQQHGLVAADVRLEVLVWTVVGCLRGAATAKAPRVNAPEALWAELEELLRRTPAGRPPRRASRTRQVPR